MLNKTVHLKLIIAAFLVFSAEALIAQNHQSPAAQKAEAKLQQQIAKYTAEFESEYNTELAADENAEFWPQSLRKTRKQFVLDTFRTETRYRLSLEQDESTSGMTSAAYQAEGDYDVLLNKYYKQLMDLLSKEDKELLKTSQRNWLAFRDSERKVFELLTKEEYSGGGSIQKVIYANSYLELTSNRVVEIFGHLEKLYMFQ